MNYSTEGLNSNFKHAEKVSARYDISINLLLKCWTAVFFFPPQTL